MNKMQLRALDASTVPLILLGTLLALVAAIAFAVWPVSTAHAAVPTLVNVIIVDADDTIDVSTAAVSVQVVVDVDDATGDPGRTNETTVTLVTNVGFWANTGTQIQTIACVIDGAAAAAAAIDTADENIVFSSTTTGADGGEAEGDDGDDADEVSSGGGADEGCQGVNGGFLVTAQATANGAYTVFASESLGGITGTEKLTLAADATLATVVLLGHTGAAGTATDVKAGGTANLPNTAIAGNDTDGLILSATAKRNETVPTAMPAATVVTFRVSSGSTGAFRDTITAGQNSNSTVAAGDDSYGTVGGAAGESGCQTGEGLQLCTARTATADDAELTTDADSEPAGTAAVSFECTGISGPYSITAAVTQGTTTVTSTAITGVCFGAATVGAGALNIPAIEAAKAAKNIGARTAVLTITLTDASGNAVPGVVIANAELKVSPTTNGVAVDGASATAATNDCGVGGEGTNATGACVITVTATNTSVLGAHTITLDKKDVGSVTTNDLGADVVASIDVVGAPATIVIDAPAAIADGETVTVTATVTTAAGNLVANTAPVTVNNTGNSVLIGASALKTTAGVATFQIRAATDSGTVVLVVTSGLATQDAELSVTSPTPPTPAGGPDQLTSQLIGEFTVYLGADTTLAQMFTDLEAAGSSVSIFWVRDINAGAWLFYSQTSSGAVVPGSSSATVLSNGDLGFLG